MMFRIFVVLAAPVALLLLIEATLRIAGYGSPSGYWLKWKHADETIHLSNPRYTEHFVPVRLSRPPEFAAIGPKDASMIRIMVLGGSAAYGDPDAAFGFCRILERLLNDRSERASFQIVNAAITAMNSHVAKNIARDSKGHGVDAFLVYMGNNEIVGPYGPSSVSGYLNSKPSFIDASIWLKKETRLGQLLGNLSGAVEQEKAGGEEWLGMEAFLQNQVSHDDPRLQHSYRIFQMNLESIIRTARKQNAQTMISTVPTNLRNCPPFASRHRAGLDSSALAEWNQHWEAGRKHQQKRDFEAALVEFELAKQIDGDHADLWFSIAKSLEHEERFPEAKQAYVTARDLDALRFRADRKINDIVRKVVAEHANQDVRLIDLEATMEKDASHGIPGNDTFFDHVHLNFRGNFLAAIGAIECLREVFPTAAIAALPADLEKTYGNCRESLLYDAVAEYRTQMTMYRRKTIPPFAGQLWHQEELQGLKQRLISDRSALKNYTFNLETQKDQVAKHPGDRYLQTRYIDSLVAAGSPKEAIRVSEAALSARPYDTQVRANCARLLALSGKRKKAMEILTDPKSPFPLKREEALYAIGSDFAKSGMIKEANEVFQELHEIDDTNTEYLINLAAAAASLKDEAAVGEYLEQALRLQPESSHAMINYGNHFVRQGKHQEARKWFAKAVELYPYEYLSQYGLGMECIRTGRAEEGVRHLKEAAMLKPDLVVSYRTLAEIAKSIGNTAAAENYANLADLFSEAPRPY